MVVAVSSSRSGSSGSSGRSSGGSGRVVWGSIQPRRFESPVNHVFVGTVLQLVILRLMIKIVSSNHGTGF